VQVFVFSDDGQILAKYVDGRLAKGRVDRKALLPELFEIIMQLQEQVVTPELEDAIVEIIRRRGGGASFGGPLNVPEDMDAGAP
jgi:hypothetical protein